jgi:hypothetical protein
MTSADLPPGRGSKRWSKPELRVEPNATVFVSLLRNRTGALSPSNRNGALRQFVSRAGSATPELAFLAGTAAAGTSGRPSHRRFNKSLSSSPILMATANRRHRDGNRGRLVYSLLYRRNPTPP